MNTDMWYLLQHSIFLWKWNNLNFKFCWPMNVMTDNLICPNIIMCTDCDCTYHFYVILKSRWQQFSFLKIYLQCILLICIHVFYSFTLPPATLTPTPPPPKENARFWRLRAEKCLWNAKTIFKGTERPLYELSVFSFSRWWSC